MEMSFETFGMLLDEITDSLPQEIFINLNGGVNLLPEAMPSHEADGVYVLGQYHYGGSLGRYINIYYGSFMQLYGGSSPQFIKQQIDHVLRHEFLHHLESMAGEKELEIKDAIKMSRFKNRFDNGFSEGNV